MFNCFKVPYRADRKKSPPPANKENVSSGEAGLVIGLSDYFLFKHYTSQEVTEELFRF